MGVGWPLDRDKIKTNWFWATPFSVIPHIFLLSTSATFLRKPGPRKTMVTGRKMVFGHVCKLLKISYLERSAIVLNGRGSAIRCGRGDFQGGHRTRLPHDGWPNTHRWCPAGRRATDTRSCDQIERLGHAHHAYCPYSCFPRGELDDPRKLLTFSQ